MWGEPKSRGKHISLQQRLSKRPRGTPTFQTPHRPAKRVPLRQLPPEEAGVQPRRIIATASSGQAQASKESRRKGGTWSRGQIKALVEFVLLHCIGDTWSTHISMAMWTAAGEFVHMRTGDDTARSG